MCSIWIHCLWNVEADGTHHSQFLVSLGFTAADSPCGGTPWNTVHEFLPLTSLFGLNFFLMTYISKKRSFPPPPRSLRQQVRLKNGAEAGNIKTKKRLLKRADEVKCRRNTRSSSNLCRKSLVTGVRSINMNTLLMKYATLSAKPKTPGAFSKSLCCLEYDKNVS